MSLVNTKAAFTEVILDEHNKVIALSGKWGTGKSYLWREVQQASPDVNVQGSLYISLFGLSSLDQVKIKILQTAIPSADDNPSCCAKLKNYFSKVPKYFKILEGFSNKFAAINNIALLALPTLIKNKVIVLDDIERKHEKLSIDEILGFIDEFTQQHGARFILILNTDQLIDKTIWDTLREKVIDHELTLETSTDEAFDIAVSGNHPTYGEILRKPIAICKITNIRIINKIIRSVNEILKGHQNLSSEILDRLIPSTVFLTAIHYKGIADGPDFDFVLDIGNPNTEEHQKKNESSDDTEKRHARWRLMLREAGIHGCDEYEHIVVGYLRSGLVENHDLSKVIDRYVSETEKMAAESAIGQLINKFIWHHNLTDAELLLEAQKLIEKVHYVDPYSITNLVDLIEKTSSGKEVAEAMLSKWLSEFSFAGYSYVNFLNRRIHPQIKEFLEKQKKDMNISRTIYEACEWIARHSGWGQAEEDTLKAATSLDFESAIRTLDPEKLKLFMSQLLEMHTSRSNFVAHFGSATDNFVDACKKIYADQNSRRLGHLIYLLFKDAGIEKEL